MTIELLQQSAVASPKTSIEEFEAYGGLLAELQRAVLWQIGDLALECERQHPSTHNQMWDVWVSPDLIGRCKAVASAYKPEERNIDATWTIHMQNVKYGDRVARVQAIVDAGQTSDEARKNPAPVVEPEKETETSADPPIVAEDPPAETQEPEAPAEKRWLLAVDVNYYIHRYFHSGAGVESASTFVGWLTRLVTRLRDTKGLTDVVCCLDSSTNHRKRLTEGWEHGYKPRVDKEEELASQLRRAPELLREANLPCVSIDDMEADDVMASYAMKFEGRVTLLTQDKDMRQCLSPTCNILQDVTWEENSETGVAMPVYKWVSVKSHMTEGSTYSGTKIVGVTPELWPHFQAIAGDATDGIKGCTGIGSKGAMDLVLAHGSVSNIIQAAKDGTAVLTKTKILCVLDFEQIADTMLKLTTLRNDLDVPQITRLAMKEPT